MLQLILQKRSGRHEKMQQVEITLPVYSCIIDCKFNSVCKSKIENGTKEQIKITQYLLYFYRDHVISNTDRISAVPPLDTKDLYRSTPSPPPRPKSAPPVQSPRYTPTPPKSARPSISSDIRPTPSSGRPQSARPRSSRPHSSKSLSASGKTARSASKYTDFSTVNAGSIQGHSNIWISTVHFYIGVDLIVGYYQKCFYNLWLKNYMNKGFCVVNIL